MSKTIDLMGLYRMVQLRMLSSGVEAAMVDPADPSVVGAQLNKRPLFDPQLTPSYSANDEDSQ